jgi:hypothetical protein
VATEQTTCHRGEALVNRIPEPALKKVNAHHDGRALPRKLGIFARKPVP